MHHMGDIQTYRDGGMENLVLLFLIATSPEGRVNMGRRIENGKRLLTGCCRSGAGSCLLRMQQR